jgi:1-deoxy-D-xylulose-5-phosphate reductoisomerase
MIPFSRIPVVVERVLSCAALPTAPGTLDEVLGVDREARLRATELLELA